MLCLSVFAEDVLIVWILGDSIVHWAQQHASRAGLDPGTLGMAYVQVFWLVERGMHVDTILRKFESATGKYGCPDVLIIHCGTNDVTFYKEHILIDKLNDIIQELLAWPTPCRVMWSDILPRTYWDIKDSNVKSQAAIDTKRKHINKKIRAKVRYPNGIKHPQFLYNSYHLIKGSAYGDQRDNVHLKPQGYKLLLTNWINSIKVIQNQLR